ncbi:hypothetical protein STENM36S_01127 [Streptomyces tendae]
MVHDRRVREARVGAAQFLGHVGVGAAQSPDVGLVDDALRVRAPGRAVVAPVEEGVGDHAEHGVPGAVARVGPALGPLEEGGVVVHHPVHGAGVRVEEQLRRVAAVADGRGPRAVDPVAVALPRADAGQVAVPDEAVNVGQRDAAVAAVVVDEHEVDPLGDLAEQGEVGALSVVHGPQGVGVPAPHGRPLPVRPGAGHRASSRMPSRVRRPAGHLGHRHDLSRHFQPLLGDRLGRPLHQRDAFAGAGARCENHDAPSPRCRWRSSPSRRCWRRGAADRCAGPGRPGAPGRCPPRP